MENAKRLAHEVAERYCTLMPQEQNTQENLELLITSAIEQAIAAERERCAPPELQELADWLENEAEGLMKNAISRRDGSRSMRNATAKELREAKVLAEKMSGHKLHGVSVTEESARADADMQDRIAAKLEAEAHKLWKWAGVLRAIRATTEPARPIAPKLLEQAYHLLTQWDKTRNEVCCEGTLVDSCSLHKWLAEFEKSYSLTPEPAGD